MLIHQSDLSSWTRCPQQFHLERAGHPGVQTSALSYGTLMHYAVEVFEREWRTGNATWAGALLIASDTFRHYWHPMHIDAVCPPVEVWLPYQTYGRFAKAGVEALQWYAGWAKDQDEEVLATELSFQVPIEGTWDEEADQPHILAGTIDRLSARFYKGRPVIEVGDYKSGKDYSYLRQNVQFTAYCYATTRKEFWYGWNGEDGFGERAPGLYQRFQHWARRGSWISLKSHKVMSCGWRGPHDYQRFAIAVEQMVASIRADIYPLSMSGENCSYCPQRKICCGVGVPDDTHGAPV